MTRWPGLLRTLKGWAGRFRRDEGGQIALIFALAAPAVVLLTVGAIDLNNVQSARTRLQDIADTAALAGANELGLAIDENSAIERARVFVAGHLAEWTDAPTVTPSIRVFDRDRQRVIEVILDGHTPSFFANMLPPGGWKYKAEARATSVGITPLCVLVIDGAQNRALNLFNKSHLQAPACLVHSNRDIEVVGGSITASQVQAVTSATGVISPAPGTGAAPIEDPFKDLDLSGQPACSTQDTVPKVINRGVWRLAPGTHCSEYLVEGKAELVLEPGDHWFAGAELVVGGTGRLTGHDVVLLFSKGSEFDFKGSSAVNLEGRKTGPFAGMVIIATRGNLENFVITSSRVENLLGVIYVPDAQLVVDGKGNNVAQNSAWTVVVARKLMLLGSPSLIINANYKVGDVPVPTGVGPRGGGSQLVQ